MISSALFDKNSTAFFYNLKAHPIQQMLDFDYVCRREGPSVTAIIHPGRNGFHKAFFGAKEILIPIFRDVPEAARAFPQTTIMINFASFRSAYASSQEALLEPTISTIVIVAEGVPEQRTKELVALAAEQGKIIIGPSTVGGIIAGKFRIGHAGGLMENVIKAKLYRPGSVGLVSKSGGIMNEMFNMISRVTDGINEGLAIGGDVYPGSTLLDHLLRYEANPEIKMMVAMSELGGGEEYGIIDAKQQGKLNKPIVMWVSGTCAEMFPWEVQFGHAGAKAGKEQESAIAKNKALRDAGIIVPASFEELESTIADTYNGLVQKGIIVPAKEIEPQALPLDYNEALKRGMIRKATNIISTISSDLGDEPTYNNILMSELVEKDYSLGQILSLLWFKKKLPTYFTTFLDKCLILCADHGPAVSGAHNAIVTARAGKDVISSLCSGLLTIGPRFGGAIDEACRYFRAACDQKMAPEDFVEEIKKKGLLIPGIGHRVKSICNPDKRVELLKKFATENFPATAYLDYALEVEKITTRKAENLILNVDGCIAALFLDALKSSGEFAAEEIDTIIEVGYMNGLFALSRSIGIIGHVLDQKRLGEGLYRHPTDDIFYG